MATSEVDITAPTDDGLPSREAHRYVKVKLEMLARYFPQFMRVCKRGYYVDGMASLGVNRIEETNQLVYGSPLLALTSAKAFSRCLFMDLRERANDILRVRADNLVGTKRRYEIRRGDVNKDLLPFMETFLDRRLPCFVVLDQNGTEVAWETVRAISNFRVDGKAELFILFSSSMGFMRTLPKDGNISQAVRDKLDRSFGCSDWLSIYERKCRNEIDAASARQRYAELYETRLRSLGYDDVFSKLVSTDGDRGRPLYHLFFATKNPIGAKIMRHIYGIVHRPDQRPLFPVDLIA